MVESSEDLTAAERDEEAPTRLDAAHAEQTQQLIRYLQKTAHIPGPSRDLIHLESPGAAFGLDSTFADQLDDDAVNGRTSAVISAIDTLTDQDQKLAALRLLAHRTREAAIGVEGSNAVSTLLQAVEHVGQGEELGLVSNEVVDALASQRSRAQLSPSDLPGAYLIGMRSRSDVGHEVVAEVLHREEARSDPVLGRLILSTADEVRAQFEEELEAITAHQLATSPDETTTALLSASDETSAKLLRGAGSLIVSSFQQPFASDADEEGNPMEPRRLEIVRILSQGIDTALDSQRPRTAEAYATIALRIDHGDLRTMVHTRLDRLNPIQAADLSREVLAATERRVVAGWPRWLRNVNVELLEQDEVRDQTARLVEKLWSLAEGQDPPSEADAGGAIEAICALGADAAVGSIPAIVRDSLAEVPTDEAALSRQERRINLAESLHEAKLFDGQAVAGPVLASLAGLARLGIAPQDVGSPFTRFVVSQVNVWAPRASGEELANLASALAESEWLSSPSKEQAMLAAASAGDKSPSPYTPSEVAALAANYQDAAATAVALWIEAFATSPTEVASVTEPYWHRSPPTAVRDALLSYSDGLDVGDRLDLITATFVHSPGVVPDESFLDAIRFSESEDRVSGGLVELFEQATNNDERRNVMRLWSALRPVNDATRRLLIRSVLLPLARLNKQALDLAIQYLDLAIPPPHGLKTELVNTYLESAEDDQQHSRVEKRLVDAGLARRSRWRRQFKTDEDG